MSPFSEAMPSKLCFGLVIGGAGVIQHLPHIEVDEQRVGTSILLGKMDLGFVKKAACVLFLFHLFYKCSVRRFF